MPTEPDITRWLISAIAKETEVDPASIDPDKSAHVLGIDSAVMVSLIFDLEDKYGVRVDPDSFFQQPSLREFSRHLVEQIESSSP